MKCRHCAAPLDAAVPRPGHRAAVQCLSDGRRRCARRRPGIRCGCWSASAAGWCRPRTSPAATSCSRDDYAYFSSFSTLAGSRTPSAMSQAMRERFGLDAAACVVEVAANDGYLLQYVQDARHPLPRHRADRQHGRGGARARASRSSSDSSAWRWRSELVGGGHAGRPDGGQQRAGPCARHQRLRRRLRAAAQAERRRHLRVPAPAAHGAREPVRHRLPRALFLPVADGGAAHLRSATAWRVFDVEELPTHGGSLRVFAQRADTGQHAPTPAVARAAGARRRAPACATAGYYSGFQAAGRRDQGRPAGLPDRGQRRAGQTVAAYGAAAKGNTLLNYAGVRPDLLPFVVDRNPAKQGKLHARQPHPDRRRGAPARATGPTTC